MGFKLHRFSFNFLYFNVKQKYNWKFIFLEEKIFQYPNINETAFSINLLGLNLNVQWYGLSYIAGILLAWFFMIKLVQKKDLWIAGNSIVERN